jgi:hypothetical protein
MPNIAILDNVQHKNLRVITDRGPAWGDAVMSALTFPAEFRTLQSTYPIVFAPNTDGTSYDALALLGFEPGENLFLGPNGWDTGVIPLSVERQPFMIGRGNGELSVHVDLDSPRVSGSRGEPVFLGYGGTSEYMERISSVLRTLHDGLAAAPGFVAALQELALIESFVLDVELDDGTGHRLTGFYTINEDKLGALSGAQLARLSQEGHLQAIYMVVASMSQFRGLIERRNRKHAAAS